MSTSPLPSVHPPRAIRHGFNLLGFLTLLSLTSVLVLILQWPASWAAASFNRLTHERVLLLEARGTIWNGSALLALGAGPGGGAATAWPQRLHWSLGLSGLSQITLHLQPDAISSASPWSWALQWRPSGWQVQVSDVDWHLPTTWLSGLGSPWNTLQPEGRLHLQSRSWAWRQEGQTVQTSGQFTLTLEQFATRLSSLKPLGDYQLAFIGAADTRIRLTTLAGALQMEGQGVWRQGHLQFVGEAWAREAQDESALSNLLGVIGPRNGARALLRVG